MVDSVTVKLDCPFDNTTEWEGEIMVTPRGQPDTSIFLACLQLTLALSAQRLRPTCLLGGGGEV